MTSIDQIKTELREIVALSEKALRAPWRYGTEPQPNGCPIIGSHGLMVAMLAHSVHEPLQKDIALANAAFIAASRTVTPQMAKTLLVAIETLEAIDNGFPNVRVRECLSDICATWEDSK